MRFNRLILASGFLIALIAFAITCNSQENKANANQEMLAQLIADRADTAKKCFDVAERAYNKGTIATDTLVIAAEKWRDAALAAATKPDEKRKVLKENVTRMQKLFGQIKVSGGPPTCLEFCELAYQDAEIMFLVFDTSQRE